MSNKPGAFRVYSGICPDPACHTKLYFPSYAASSVECTGCGQHHEKEILLNVEHIQDPEQAIRNLLRSALLSRSALKKGAELVKVKGYSNYHCKLLSPLLTKYGMDRSTGKAKLLREMGQGENFDCSHVGDRAFAIELEYLETAGYGRDRTGAVRYLHDTVGAITAVNNSEERLVPIHVDGDGHCLVHAVSRALIGREIFWNALRTNLQSHLEVNLPKYQALFIDFIHESEWLDIVNEAGPNFQPPDGQPLGLRNIHIFGLANVLHRPILLLDSLAGMRSSADYTGTFLPALVPVHMCKSKDGTLYPPLAIAWSSSGRNHYIPLVGIMGKAVPRMPKWLIPKAWGIPNDLVKAYIEFDDSECCLIGGNKFLQERYIQRLMKAMDEKFFETQGIAASLVTEVHQFLYKPSGLVGVLPQTVIETTQQSVQDGHLLRCLSCHAVSQQQTTVNQDWLQPGGALYREAQMHTREGLVDGLMYSFPQQSLVCLYEEEKDVLKPVKYKGVLLSECTLCKGPLRQVRGDGSAVYVNGDRTTTPVQGSSQCLCGYKHFWEEKEYDNLPEVIPVTLEWGGKSIKETVNWFQYEDDVSMNSNVYAVASKLVQKYFPGEFGSERLVQKVVDTILRQTARKEGENKGARPNIPSLEASTSVSQPEEVAVDTYVPSKIILTGEKKKTFHKEELTMSEAEKIVKARTEHNAAVVQKKRSGEQGVKKTPEKSPTPPKQQKEKQSASSSSPRNQTTADARPSTPTSPISPRVDKKIRLSSSKGAQALLTLPLNTTFSQLQDAIHLKLGILPEQQKIRYGFPPCPLHPPEEGKEEDPVPVQHGDRVMVEVILAPEPAPPEQPDAEMAEEKKGEAASTGEEEGISEGVQESVAAPKEGTQMEVDSNTAALASALMSALSGTLTNDLWEAACRNPAMFNNGGYYYNLVLNDLSTLKDDQHCTIPHLPGKVFVYNKEKDRLDLCLGKVHVQVQPLSQEVLAQDQQAATGQSAHQGSSVLSSEASFSGAINRDSARSRLAFSGEGRSLSGLAPSSPRRSTDEFRPQASQQRPVLGFSLPMTLRTPTSTSTVTNPLPNQLDTEIPSGHQSKEETGPPQPSVAEHQPMQENIKVVTYMEVVSPPQRAQMTQEEMEEEPVQKSPEQNKNTNDEKEPQSIPVMETASLPQNITTTLIKQQTEPETSSTQDSVTDTQDSQPVDVAVSTITTDVDIQESAQDDPASPASKGGTDEIEERSPVLDVCNEMEVEEGETSVSTITAPKQNNSSATDQTNVGEIHDELTVRSPGASSPSDMDVEQDVTADQVDAKVDLDPSAITCGENVAEESSISEMKEGEGSCERDKKVVESKNTGMMDEQLIAEGGKMNYCSAEEKAVAEEAIG